MSVKLFLKILLYFFFTLLISCGDSTPTSNTYEQECNDCTGGATCDSTTRPYVEGLPMCEDLYPERYYQLSSSSLSSVYSSIANLSSSSSINADNEAPVVQIASALEDTILNYATIEVDLTDRSTNITLFVMFGGDTIGYERGKSTGMVDIKIEVTQPDMFWVQEPFVIKAVDQNGNIGSSELVQLVVKPSIPENGGSAQAVIDLLYYEENGSHDAFGGSADPQISMYVESYSRGRKIYGFQTGVLYSATDDSYWSGHSLDTVHIIPYADSIVFRAQVIDIDLNINDNISPGYVLTLKNPSIGYSGSDTLTGGGADVGFSYEIIEVME